MKGFVRILAIVIASLPATAIAQEVSAESLEIVGLKAALAIGSGLCIGIASLGGALGQGRVGMAAVEGMSRNPGAAGKVMTFMIIAMALIESLVIYALVIAFLLQGKI